MNKFDKEIWTDTYFDNAEYTIVSGYHNKYNNATLRRTIYYHKKLNVVIIRDIGKSSEKRKWINRFNLNEKVNYSLSDDNQAVLKFDEDYIIISNLTNQYVKCIDSLTNEFVEKPFYSNKVNQKINNSQLIYEDEYKEETEHIFCITFNEKNIIHIKKERNYLVLSKSGIEVRLPIV